MGEPRSRGCLKSCGCGCAVLTLLVGLGLLGVGGYGFSQRPGDPEPREESLVAELGVEAGDAGDEAAAPSPEGGESEPTPIEPAPLDWEDVRGVVRLDLSQGFFRIRPAEPGERPRVEAQYDASTHSLVEEATESADGWLWSVQVAPRVGFLGQLFAGQRQEPRVTVVLPSDRPYRLELATSMGAAEVELGGLPLVSVEASSSMGQQTLAFSKPTPRPLESLELTSRMGQATRTGIGNASPQRVTVRHGFGQCTIGLDGPWAGLSEAGEGANPEIVVATRMGEAVVRIPTNVPVAVLETQVDGGEVLGADAIRETTSDRGLNIRTETGMGTLRFER